MPTNVVNIEKPQKAKIQSALQSVPARIASIDILRAVTMVLMIFVNDLWSLTNIPGWLDHVPRGVDGMGLADVIFPAFLFIVGMSIPFAIDARRKKGDNNIQLTIHILSRTLALLVMGLFLVNGENINPTATGMQRVVWYSLSCLSFILIWNTYSTKTQPVVARSLKAVGIGVLALLAIVYRGGDAENLVFFSIFWWGILGLIGWSYMVASLVTAFSGKKHYGPLAAWIIFVILSMISSEGLLPGDSFLRSILPNPILGGTLIAFTLGGVLTTMIFQHFRSKNTPLQVMLVLGIISVILFGLGFYTNNFWIVSKLSATTPWLFLCSGITILAFIFIYWLADLKGKAHWFNVIKPAGTDTLLCYLIPYFAYAFVVLSGISWPEIMLTGYVGLIKSFAFAFLCVGITAFLRNNGVRLKL